MNNDLSQENLNELESFIDSVFHTYKDKYYESSGAMRDKLDHIIRVTAIVDKNWPGDQMARISAKVHDIGRFPQYEILGKFDDSKVLHHYLGEDFIARAVYQKKIKKTEELDLLRYVMKYHGRESYIPFKEEIPEKAKKYIDIVSRVDAIENGCIGAIGYLVRESETDAKNYRNANPELDMKSVSPEVMEFFKKGEKFDKMVYCKTYADYALFAAVLAIQALKGKDREIALDAMSHYKCSRPTEKGKVQYDNAIDGYDDIFSILVNPKDKAVAMDVLKGFFENPEYEYKPRKTEAPDEPLV